MEKVFNDLQAAWRSDLPQDVIDAMKGAAKFIEELRKVVKEE